jgi:hypothetical protein
MKAKTTATTPTLKPITTAPTEITLAWLQVVVMPNGEVICSGQTVGWFKTHQSYLRKAD